ncbi:Trypsin-2, partial [Gryllus bimaculatus]
VATPFEWSDAVQPVKLPRLLEDTVEYTPATVIGWGMNYTGSPIMTKLQTAEIEIVSDADCLEAYGGDIHTTNICAGTSEGGKNACIGDSGGPLIANDQQVGIVSWSVIPCAKKGYPVVYTEVSHYIDWIREVTTANSGPYEKEEEKEEEKESKPEDKPEDNEAVKPEEKESAKPDEKA